MIAGKVTENEDHTFSEAPSQILSLDTCTASHVVEKLKDQLLSEPQINALAALCGRLVVSTPSLVQQDGTFFLDDLYTAKRLEGLAGGHPLKAGNYAFDRIANIFILRHALPSARELKVKVIKAWLPPLPSMHLPPPENTMPRVPKADDISSLPSLTLSAQSPPLMIPLSLSTNTSSSSSISSTSRTAYSPPAATSTPSKKSKRLSLGAHSFSFSLDSLAFMTSLQKLAVSPPHLPNTPETLSSRGGEGDSPLSTSPPRQKGGASSPSSSSKHGSFIKKS